jgi:hypothetical protein
MDFEEMKMIWDTQNAEPLYAVNERALRHSVRGKTRRLKRIIVFFETSVLVTTVGLSAMYLISPLLRGQQYERFVSAAILLGAAAYFFVGISSRRRREAGFEPSLLGEIDKGLWQVRHHVSRARGVRWSLLTPLTLAVVLDWVLPIGDVHLEWPFLLFLLLMALSAWGIEYEIRYCYLPKERKLVALRRMLVERES